MANEIRRHGAWFLVLSVAAGIVGCEGSGGSPTLPGSGAEEGAAVAVLANAPLANARTTPAVAPPAPAGDKPTPERGRYVIAVGGCNDCHTPGFMEKGWAVPETEWLTGVPVGWKGPWGTTYASNLRLFLQDFDEDTFVQVVRVRNTRPPMPWPNLHAMSDADLRSVYRYIRSLPVKGEKMPAYVPPGQEPTTVYVNMFPQTPSARADAR